MALTARFIGYFKPEKKIHLPISNMENQNSEEELYKILGIVDQNIKNIKKAKNEYEIEDKTGPKNDSLWTNNSIRIEMEEEKSEPHRNTTNIISK